MLRGGVNSAPEASSAKPLAGPDRRAGEVLVHEAHHGSTLADRGRAALDRAGAHVSGRIHTADAGLEQAVRRGLRTREDEPVGVARDDVGEPVGAGIGAQEEEQEGERQLAAVGKRDGPQLTCLSVQRGDFAQAE